MALSPTLRAGIALAAYAEPLIEGRRVIVFGDASSGLAEQLLERGARLVHVYDADPTRLAEAATRNASRNIAFAPLAESGLAVREGAFDVALVENLAASSDAAGVVKRAKKALSSRGALIAASPNPETRVKLLGDPQPAATELDYYALYDLIAAEFEHVRMLGQMPFVGYAVADFAPEGEPEPALDTGFVPGGAEEPEWFVALAAQRPVRLEDFAVVQLPFAAVLDRPARPREPAPPPAPAVDVAPLHAEIARLQSELERRDAWIAQLESRAEAADTRADEVQAELEERRSGAESAQRDLAEARRRVAALESELARHQEHLARLQNTVERLPALESGAARAVELEQELSRVSALLEKMQKTEAVDAGAEVAALERQLAERGSEIRRLEQDLRTTERVGRQLLDELEQAKAGDGAAAAAEVGALGQKLDTLASLNAELQADLQAARWTIAGLEGRLAEKAPAAATGDRERLEEDLQQARADLQRLAALVEQLKATTGATGAEASR